MSSLDDTEQWFLHHLSTGVWMTENPTRRSLISLSLLVVQGPVSLPLRLPVEIAAEPDRQGASIDLEPWTGVAFTARCGVNVVPLGFGIYQPVSLRSWEDSLPASRLTMLKAVGFDHVRIALDPTPALGALTAAAFAEALAVAKHAIDATLRANLKVILDLHVATAGPWSTQAIEADYPNGPKWRRYLQVAGGFGELCIQYPTARLAFEIYNENSNNETFGNTAWAERVRVLWGAVRSVNRKTTLLVGGSFYSSIEGLSDLKASSFDKNTGFVVHNYNPTIFTHQGAAQYIRYVARLHYPPIPSDKAAAIEAMTSRVDASGLSDADKVQARRDQTRRLNVYFDTPQGPNYVAAKIQAVSHWAVRNRVAANRIFVTEFGSHNDHDFLGAALIARLAWAQDVDFGHEAAGFCRTVWNYNSPDYWDITDEDGSWRIRNGFLLAFGLRPSGGHEPEADKLFGSLPTQPSTTRKALISETIRQLKDNGVWARLDQLYVFAASEVMAAATDWKRGVVKLDLGQLRFSPEQGVANRASEPGFLAVSWPSGDGGTLGEVPFKGDDNHAGLLVMGNRRDCRVDISFDAPLSRLRLDPEGVSADGGSPLVRPSGDAPQIHLIQSQTPNHPSTLYADGSLIATAALGREPLSQALRVGFEAFNQASCAMLHVGAGLTADEAKAFYTIARFYLTGISRKSADD